MKFSALPFVLAAAAASITNVSAFTASRSSSHRFTRTDTTQRGFKTSDGPETTAVLEKTDLSSTTISLDSDQAELATPAFVRGRSVPNLLRDGDETENGAPRYRLPLGIKLTGGEKLRKDGLTGKGVKVGVIDSGVAAQHPGFNGKVVKQHWLRRGTPLMYDDHGTHVAGTIQ